MVVTQVPDPERPALSLASFGPPLLEEEARVALLDDLEETLTGLRWNDPPLPGSPLGDIDYVPAWREEGLDWPSTALTMVGRQRLRNFRHLIERVVREGVPGDIIEAGVWRGGASILARATLASLGVTDRQLIVADSFQGLPPPDVEQWPADAGSDLHTYRELAISQAEVRANFERFGMLDDRVTFLEGWFRDTMPHVPSSTLAVMRLDGDMYESTMDPLVHLYDRLSVGGWVIIDDYLLKPCRVATHDFFAARGIDPELLPIDRVGRCFQKT